MLRAWRIFIASTISLAFLLGMGIWYGHQQLEAYQEQRQAIEKATTRVAALNQLQMDHTNLEVYQMEVAKQRQMAEKLLPRNIQMAELLAYVQQTARNSGLELQELMPMDSKPLGKLQIQPVKVKLQGDYFHLLDFLRQLDKGAPLVHIGNMELKQQPEGLSSKFTLNFYAG